MTQLLAHFDDIINSLRVDADTDSIYLDYAKAFDKVDHRLLIAKMVRYQFPPKIVDWVSTIDSRNK